MTLQLAPPTPSIADRGELRTLRIEERGNAVRRRYWTGLPWQLGTAMYWEGIARTSPKPSDYRLGRTLSEEVGACLLGGYGMPYALGAAAFEALKAAGVFGVGSAPEARTIESLLRQPLLVGKSLRRYRFPHQRAERLSTALAAISQDAHPTDALELRDWLVRLPGIGPKTASWIVRNHLSSREVAIIDIHIARAGVVAGVFDPDWRIESDYRIFEQAFLQWASQAGVDPAFLDACIWGVLANAGGDARDILGVETVGSRLAPVWPVAHHGALASRTT